MEGVLYGPTPPLPVSYAEIRPYFTSRARIPVCVRWCAPASSPSARPAWNLLGTFSLSPGTAHKVTFTDQANGYVIADAIRLVTVAIQAEQKLCFVHAGHLNTPRLVADATGTTVWRWDQGEPFGSNPANEDASGLEAFDYPTWGAMFSAGHHLYFATNCLAIRLYRYGRFSTRISSSSRAATASLNA